MTQPLHHSSQLRNRDVTSPLQDRRLRIVRSLNLGRHLVASACPPHSHAGMPPINTPPSIHQPNHHALTRSVAISLLHFSAGGQCIMKSSSMWMRMPPPSLPARTQSASGHSSAVIADRVARCHRRAHTPHRAHAPQGIQRSQPVRTRPGSLFPRDADDGGPRRRVRGIGYRL